MTALLLHHREGVRALAFCDGGRLLASVGGERDRRIRLWDVETGRLSSYLGEEDEHESEPLFAAAGGPWIYTATRWVVRRFDPVEGALDAAWGAPRGAVRAFACSRDGASVAAGGARERRMDHAPVSVWVHGAEEPRAVLRAHRSAVNAVALTEVAPTFLSDGGPALLSADSDGSIELTDLATGEVVEGGGVSQPPPTRGCLPLRADPVVALAHRAGEDPLLAVVGQFGGLRLGAGIPHLSDAPALALPEPAWGVAFLPDGTLAVASEAGRVHVVDPAPAAGIVRTLEPRSPGPPSAFAVSPRGAVALARGGDVLLWA